MSNLFKGLASSSTDSPDPAKGRNPAINGEAKMPDQQLHLKLIADSVKLGTDVSICPFTNLYGCEIGSNTKIGPFVEIQKGARIGSNCKISSHCFICEGVTIEDNVFIGHNVTFINDLFPRAVNGGGGLQTEKDWVCVPTRIKRGASIGSSATILCGISIGENAMVGAGSMVTRDVPPNAIVAGNPARVKNFRVEMDRQNESTLSRPQSAA